jgi:hypothetical protein
MGQLVGGDGQVEGCAFVKAQAGTLELELDLGCWH